MLIVREWHVGPLLKSGKSRSTWHAAHFRPLGAVQKGLFLTSCVQFRTATPRPVWLACWWPRWRPRGSSVEVVRAMKSSIPVNFLWGSARSCRVVPVHFWLPIGGPVLSLHVRAPLPVPRRPQRRVQHAAMNSSLVPVNRRGARHAPVARPPFTFGHIVRPGIKFSPCARAGPRAAVAEDEGLSFLA
jgi:hypothetical protein